MTDEPLDPNTLYADGFEDALVGLGWQHTKVIAVYDYNKCGVYSPTYEPTTLYSIHSMASSCVISSRSMSISTHLL